MSLAIVEEAGLTDVGRQRKTNEDSYFESSPVFAVADGMGGARAGEVASRIAVEVFEEADREPGNSPEAQLEAIVREANRRIHGLAQEDESRAGMGTTLTAVMVGEHDVSVGHVGDSRAYRLTDDHLERLTTDHSLVEELVRRGELTREGAESHPQRSIITRALGPEADVDVETFTVTGCPGHVYVLCSDGLTGMVSEERLEQVLRNRESLAGAAQELVNIANANGGRDNITVVLFRLGEVGDAPEEQDTGEIDPAMVRAAAGAAGDPPPQPDRETFLLDAESAERARAAERPRGGAQATAEAPAAASPSTEAPAPARPPPSGRRRRRRGRTALRILLSLAVVGALIAGAVLAVRQAYFLGTDERGLVTLYQGLPYEGPFEIRLYSEEYTSAVPAGSLPALRRERVLDHELRGRRDAADLVRALERDRMRAR